MCDQWSKMIKSGHKTCFYVGKEVVGLSLSKILKRRMVKRVWGCFLRI